MLVLTRKPGEKVVIDGGITITVIEAKGGKVRIGIEAPPHVSILRSELALEREAEMFRNQWETVTPKVESARVPGASGNAVLCAPA
jgi:carbon storage regulator